MKSLADLKGVVAGERQQLTETTSKDISGHVQRRFILSRRSLD